MSRREHASNLLVRAWHAIKDALTWVFARDVQTEERIKRQGQLHPRQEMRGRTFDGNMGGW